MSRHYASGVKPMLVHVSVISAFLDSMDSRIVMNVHVRRKVPLRKYAMRQLRCVNARQAFFCGLQGIARIICANYYFHLCFLSALIFLVFLCRVALRLNVSCGCITFPTPRNSRSADYSKTFPLSAILVPLHSQ